MNCKNELKLYFLLFVIFVAPFSYSEQVQNVEYRVLESGQYGPYADSGKQIIVINNISQLENKFRTYPTNSTPNVDFRKNVVVLINMGEKPSGGYEVDVERIIDDKENTTITATFSSPGSSCISAAVMTNPYIFIEVATTKNILLNERHVIKECE